MELLGVLSIIRAHGLNMRKEEGRRERETENTKEKYDGERQEKGRSVASNTSSSIKQPPIMARM